MENEDLRQRLQILEALTGKDTSFISIMEDSEKNDFPSRMKPPDSLGRMGTGLEQIEEFTVKSKFSKPPKSIRKNNIAVGGYSSNNFNNLSLYGHKKKKSGMKQVN